MARTYLQRRVADWHALMGARPAPEIPTNLDDREREILAKICGEEFAELIVALVGADRADEIFKAAVHKCLVKRDSVAPGDLAEIVDGAVDSQYVASGVMWRAGVEDQVFVDEVCDTNDAKAGGHQDEHGKWHKPPGWKPPRIRELLLSKGWVPWST